MKKDAIDTMFPITNEVIDPETGEVLNTATLQEMEKKLAVLEQLIGASYLQVALALRTIRDERLYLCRCTSFNEYIENYLPFSVRHAYRYLQLADSFTPSALKKLEKNAPMQLVLQIAKDDDLVEQINTATDEDEIKKLIEQARQKERARIQKQIDQMQQMLEGKEAIIESLRNESLQKEQAIERLKDAVQKAATREIDPNEIIFITHKKEALALLEESFAYILQKLNEIANIPHELLDPDVVGKLNYVVVAIKSAIKRIEDIYFTYLVQPNERVSILPEDEL